MLLHFIVLRQSQRLQICCTICFLNPNIVIYRAAIRKMKLPPPVIAKELEIFEKVFKESVKSHVSLLDTIMRYIVKRKGKQLRPMFVLLSAKLGRGSK